MPNGPGIIHAKWVQGSFMSSKQGIIHAKRARDHSCQEGQGSFMASGPGICEVRPTIHTHKSRCWVDSYPEAFHAIHWLEGETARIRLPKKSLNLTRDHRQYWACSAFWFRRASIMSGPNAFPNNALKSEALQNRNYLHKMLLCTFELTEFNLTWRADTTQPNNNNVYE